MGSHPSGERSRVGVLLGSYLPAEEFGPLARLAEELGYGELWMPEDYFYSGGVAGAAIALSATQHMPVGVGVVSALVRHPAVFAQECAMLSNAFPGRFWPGIGVGGHYWLRQMGLYQKRQLATLRECVQSVRALLGGERVTLDGEIFHLDDVALTRPPAVVPPVYCGVLGPNMVTLAGEISDGLMIGVTAPPQYVRWAKDRLAAAPNPHGRTHRLPTVVVFSVDRDAKKAKQAIREKMAVYLGRIGASGYMDVYGISDDLRAIIDGAGPSAEERAAAMLREMPDEWLDDLAVAGDPDECASKIDRFFEAGSDSVVLSPFPIEDRETVLRLAAEEVVPRLSAPLFA